jgi:outer membrane protein OmpA-like peptidoglycan-associated protein
MTYRLGFSLFGVAAAVLGAGCAHNPPQELLDARAAYEKASQGPAAKYNPLELSEAKKVLDHANQEYDSDPGSDYTRDVAYIALRKVEIADADGRVEEANQQRAQAEQRASQLTQQQLAQTQQQLNQTAQQLEAERQAAASLSRIANVRQDARGTVITLTGGVLFPSGKASLLPDARQKLDQVAEALKNTSGQLVVEGHTDSRGSNRVNQRLSERRAETVRNYLVERGVPPERITSKGLGKSQPIASNRTAEGRANNRRVEIVMQQQPAYGGAGQNGTSPTNSNARTPAIDTTRPNSDSNGVRR